MNAPVTSSAGRLFDAVAALVGMRQVGSFEGHAAMELEWAADSAPAEDAEPVAVYGVVLDRGPDVREVVVDVRRGEAIGRIAARFHNTMDEATVSVARRTGEPRVALTRGCFQNAALLTRSVERVRAAGLEPVWHRRVPPNDSGIALGQAVAAGRALEESAGCASPSPERS